MLNPHVQGDRFKKMIKSIIFATTISNPNITAGHPNKGKVKKNVGALKSSAIAKKPKAERPKPMALNIKITLSEGGKGLNPVCFFIKNAMCKN